MSAARNFCEEVYRVVPEKIDLIPHGIPDMPFVDPSFHKDLFGVEGKIVLLSFGLLVGEQGNRECHRRPARHFGQASERRLLHRRRDPSPRHAARRRNLPFVPAMAGSRKGVEGHVIFYNRFVSLEELVEFIGAADIYITPYLNPAQIVSGTLAYTLGAGKAVISTPYWYAEEMLAEDRGASGAVP